MQDAPGKNSSQLKAGQAEDEIESGKRLGETRGLLEKITQDINQSRAIH